MNAMNSAKEPDFIEWAQGIAMLLVLTWLLAAMGHWARQWWDWAGLMPLFAALLTLLGWPFGMALITLSLCNHPKQRRGWLTLWLFILVGLLGFFLCAYALAPLALGVA
jgi:hypothetical protein